MGSDPTRAWDAKHGQSQLEHATVLRNGSGYNTDGKDWGKLSSPIVLRARVFGNPAAEGPRLPGVSMSQ